MRNSNRETWFRKGEFHVRSGQVPDVTVCAKSLKWRVHKSVLSTASAYWNVICNGPFQVSHTLCLRTICVTDMLSQESSSQVINLREDSPPAIARLLRYIYTGDYYCKVSMTWEPDEMLEHVEMWKLADKYNMPALGALAITKFEAVLKNDHTWSLSLIYRELPELEDFEFIKAVYEKCHDIDPRFRNAIHAECKQGLAGIVSDKEEYRHWREFMDEYPEFRHAMLTYAAAQLEEDRDTISRDRREIEELTSQLRRCVHILETPTRGCDWADTEW